MVALHENDPIPIILHGAIRLKLKKKIFIFISLPLIIEKKSKQNYR
jgi:hypothetical protein